MRISDWSSDVCSSDLKVVGLLRRPGRRRCTLRSASGTCEKTHAPPQEGQRPNAPLTIAGHRDFGCTCGNGVLDARSNASMTLPISKTRGHDWQLLWRRGSYWRGGIQMFISPTAHMKGKIAISSLN